MNDFSKVKFKWTFRDYQQRVLDNCQRFLNDGKVNIVAAPGSGKTILGLEIIKRLNAPCIIFSPTTTIKQQWKERFQEAFIDENQNVDDYVSLDLNNIKLINSITYQALYSAMDKIAINEEDETIDYSNIDLFKLMKEKNIKTICLDEAHHLQNKWQQSLEKFIKGIDSECKIIALTATPPYDASKSEWDRYISVCGPIDDEIFVPELVKEGTLCPHQDYIIFNYPSEEEIITYKSYREKSFDAIKQIANLKFISILSNRLIEIYSEGSDYIYANYKQIISLFSFLHNYEKPYDYFIYKKISKNKIIPSFNLKHAQQAIQFLLNDEVITVKEEKEIIREILKSKGLIIRNIVELELNDKIKRSLTSSCGKLKSISFISKNEHESLKDKLRLLILTDFIKKETVVNVATENKLEDLSVVSIFEQLRRDNIGVSLGVLSGSLVILPISLKDELLDLGLNTGDYKIKPLADTGYGVYTFKGSNKDKVKIVSSLFENGLINVLIGTQALLGEGWDSPCINSLILASYVGSFMLSNQMRGRAIRQYKKDHNKSANIWHLVTLEPDYLFETKDSSYKGEISSCDYETLSRRFESFLAPSYRDGTIETGIDRVTIITPPYTKENFENINNLMIEKALNRDAMSKSWKDALFNNSQTVIENIVDKKAKLPVFTFSNIIGLIFTFSLFVILALCLAYFSFITLVLIVILCLLFSKKVAKLLKYLFNHISSKKSLLSLSNSVLKTFKVMNLINSRARVKAQKRGSVDTGISLIHASLYEQNIFNDAIKEMLSPIDNPRYIFVKKNLFGALNYCYSLSCPSAFSKNSKSIEIITYYISKSIGEVEAIYTYNEEGRKILSKCRKRSFISKNAKMIQKKQKVNRRKY